MNRAFKLRCLLSLTVVFALTFVACGKKARGNAAMPSVVCNLIVDSASPSYPATVQVTNSTGHTLSLYKVFLPEDGVPVVDMFVVRRDGSRVQYKGAMAKLPGRPSEDDFVSVKSGGRISATIPIAENYDVTLPGEYSVKYSIAHPQPNGETLGVISNEVHFTVPKKNSK